MWDAERIISVSIFAFFGYVALHGHRLNQDCWLCQYRGLATIGLPVIIGFYTEIGTKEKIDDYLDKIIGND